uniref:Retrotransposon gag domain-containing protein n=1 Tax=Tanacetum cinerariifolium TaxID=118510 RepID=A0A6L2KHA4_TANCI|nr:hypothetical protein [Tanacetum cinerariifolium]
MRELREDTFFGKKNDDTHEHVKRVLDIVSLFNIPRVSHDAVMLRVFSITLTKAAKRWVDRLSLGTVDSWDLLKKHLSKGTVDSWDLLKKAFIQRRPFLATIHAEIDDFNKEISLGIKDDRVTFNMDKKIHNFTTHVGKIYMINSIQNDESPSRSNALLDKSSRFNKSDSLHNENNYIQERSSKKTRIVKSDTNLLSMHFCKPFKQICNGILKVWPTCDPTMKICHGGIKIYRMNEEGVLKFWYCYLDGDRESIKESGLSFPEFLLVKEERTYARRHMGKLQKSTRDNTYWWYDQKSKEKERREIGFDIEGENGSRFREMIRKEVESGRKVHRKTEERTYARRHMGKLQKSTRDNTYWWYDQKSKEKERREIGFDIEGENGSRFREMIRKEVESGRKVHRKT